MRIIAGKFKGKRLESPKTEKTRPTLDRVKEALFSIITPYIENAQVLDLFSGTGNLGIEALSRGAAFAYLNDIQNESISTILKNVTLTNTKKCVKITKKDYTKCLKQFIENDTYFDIIFLDPPYESNHALNTLKIISESVDKILSKDGIIIYELDKSQMKKDSDAYKNYENIECFDERIYGRVLLRMYRWR
jgi:16S rRNA (guanine(966)-N(2))-methyltransferase RsmD